MTGDLVGTTVGGKYKVVSKIGTGGVGDVYEATNEGDEGWSGSQSVALKVLRLDDENLAARFLREAKTMALFAHPNIVELVEVGKLDDGRLFFAAELVRGDTLRALMDAGPVAPKRALGIVRQILDALGHAHAMGVVHRDIKPENVMLVEDSDAVKILDFGVAKLIGDTPAVLGEGTLTITGYGALGTPYYMSPEAVLGRPLDARADIYSIGALLFEMLTGKPPYMHEDVAVLMRMHAAAPIPPVPDATPEVALVLDEALAKKPELRFATAAEMITAVDAAMRSLDPLPVPVSTKSTDVFGALPMKPPATPAAGTAAIAAPTGTAVDPSASKPTSFSPTHIPSASQPVQPEPGPEIRAKRSSRVNLPGVAPYQTPPRGSATVPLASQPPAPAPPSPSIPPAPVPAAPPELVVRPSAPLFSPPMPAVAPKPPHALVVLAKRHKKYLIAAAAFLVLLVIALIVAPGGGKKPPAKAGDKPGRPAAIQSNPELAKAAADLIAAGKPSNAAALIEREDIGDDPETLVVLGHARIGANRRLDGLAAYERAILLDKKQAADPRVRASVIRVLESRDGVAGVVALELAMRLDPPAHDLVKQAAATAKLGDVRRRALAIAEREKISEGIDRVESWSLDLAQATTCEERLVAIAKLRRSADPRAIPALKRARTFRCVEREVSEAIAFLETQAPPPAPNP